MDRSLDEPPVPNVEQVQRMRRVLGSGIDRMAEIGMSRSDLMYAAMILALDLARDVIGPFNVVEWLRNTADLQERSLLDGLPDAGRTLQ